LERLQKFCRKIGAALAEFGAAGHPMELSQDFQEQRLGGLLAEENAGHPAAEAMPLLAALVCFSAFDIALHDAFGVAVGKPSFELLSGEYLSRDLSAFLDGDARFAGKYPSDYLLPQRREQMRVWHLVGGLDPLDVGEGDAGPDDGHPHRLREWIQRDGLKCLKVKLRGDGAGWDLERMRRVGRIAVESGVLWLSADFNCTVREPQYVNAVLDTLRDEEPEVYARILYVEQPFPYELEHYPIRVRSVSARKPLFLDESAHDWRHVRMGLELGWTGVALKTCKTLTGALLSACWAQEEGMTLMVQDLTNPMLAQIPHVLLAAHLPTIMGVESNSMQYYPAASELEARVHPGIYQRRAGILDLGSVRGPGMGYRIDEMNRPLPSAAGHWTRGATDSGARA
jgi:L-alanine-DL-glutamate epimerase-like enolase superfamily enzyme